MSSTDTQIINPVAVEEIAGWTRAMATTFLEDPDSDEVQSQIASLARDWDPLRAWGARDGARWVATLRSMPRLLAVPGYRGGTADLRVDAVTNVTVAATHRRLGLMTGMLSGSLQAARARGEALSILIAAEWPIYGRFGYAPATLSASYELRRGRAGAGALVAGEPSRVRQVDREHFGDVAAGVFAAARQRWAGQIDRGAAWWDRMLGRDGYGPSDELPHNWFVHEGDGGPDGLLAWKASGSWGLVPPFKSVEVWDLASATDAAYRDLWAYLSSIDLVEHVVLRNRPPQEPVRWLLGDGRALVKNQEVDFLWLRLLDVPAALAARRYAVPAEIVLQVIDDAAPGFASGRFRLSADGERVACEPTSDSADVAISQQALSSIYLGGFRLKEMLGPNVAQEHSAGALQLLDLMFSTALAPWNATWF